MRVSAKQGINKALFIVGLLILVNPAYAAPAFPDFTAMMQSIAATLTPVQELVVWVAYIMGVVFTYRALYHLKVYGELRTMMASRTGLKEPLTYLMVAAIFIYLPTALEIVLQTTFGDESVVAYSDLSYANAADYGQAFRSVLYLIQIVGLIAFIRGWMIIAKGTAEGQQAGWGKGLMHIVGGIMAINIVATSNIVTATLGFSG